MKDQFCLDTPLRNQLHELRSELELATRTATLDEPTSPGHVLIPTTGCGVFFDTCGGSCTGSCWGSCRGDCSGSSK